MRRQVDRRYYLKRVLNPHLISFPRNYMFVPQESYLILFLRQTMPTFLKITHVT